MIVKSMKEVYENSAAEFHRHLDTCQACRDKPVGFCPVGLQLVRDVTVGK